MRGLDVVLLILLIVTLGLGAYAVIQSIPGSVTEFKPGEIDGKPNNVYVNESNMGQFYPNMRYPDKKITYSVSESCGSIKEKRITEAFNILAEETMLTFNQVGADGEIDITCSDVDLESVDKSHFVAGEGGPKDIYNSGVYYVITSGQVSLFRDEKCDRPQIALHEILHALGFDHNNDKKSIMYPITSCDEILDGYIINLINKLYSVPSLPDLAITKSSATKTGKYLSFSIEVSNLGLIDDSEASLVLFVDGEKIREFELNSIPIGSKKTIKVDNLSVPKDALNIEFVVNSLQEDEISLSNNKAALNSITE